MRIKYGAGEHFRMSLGSLSTGRVHLVQLVSCIASPAHTDDLFVCVESICDEHTFFPICYRDRTKCAFRKLPTTLLLYFFFFKLRIPTFSLQLQSNRKHRKLLVSPSINHYFCKQRERNGSSLKPRFSFFPSTQNSSDRTLLQLNFHAFLQYT